MRLKCVITDDEPVARKGLAGYIEKIDYLELVGTCGDAISLNNFLREQSVDLIFLDIEMPYMSGISLLKGLQNPPMVIFTTAFEQYAIDGFELAAVDYLLKPVSFERFLKAANRAYEVFKKDHHPKTIEQGFIFVKAGDKWVKLNWSEVIYLEAKENYTSVVTETGKFMILSTLKSFLEAAPEGTLLQTHKSFLVNTSKITGLQLQILELGTFEVPVSRSMKDQVQQFIMQHHILKK
ncbi:DNA-binding response regulator [Chitinophaga caeni]|uniref:DNA-binding response regulator n=1 Tax=Chitinophaga caeni TaxID=2029983 RepID=A0A291QSM4_9BACT|nr:LytTR family DNA-binding domain-containing protein [Chitinophaga caeni]ATL46960.1 DNA-binding response regulator [Chitinophaga caeni]